MNDINIKKNIIPCNYTKKENREIKYIVIHYTAGVTSKKGSALNCAKYTFGNPDNDISAHYIVDDFDIVQAVEDENVAWHCGAKKYIHPYCRNNNSIGIEICSNHDNFLGYDKTLASDPGWYFTDKSLELAAKLTGYLMFKYDIPIYNVIRHYDVTGKDCPSPMVDENKNGNHNWYAFIQSVIKQHKEYVDLYKNVEDVEKVETKTYKTLEEIPEWGRSSIKWFVENKYLTGTGDGNLNLSYDLLRMLVILHRIIEKGDIDGKFS